MGWVVYGLNGITSGPSNGHRSDHNFQDRASLKGILVTEKTNWTKI